MKKSFWSLIVAFFVFFGASTSSAYADYEEIVYLVCGCEHQEESEVILPIRRKAVDLLEDLRAGYDEILLYDLVHSQMIQAMRSEGLTLKRLGTTNKDLRDLRAFTARREAAKWLRLLRDGNSYVSYNWSVKYMFEAMKVGNMTLRGLGTSEEGLKEIEIITARRVARRIFDGLRNGTDHSSADAILFPLLEAMETGRMDFEDMDSSLEKFHIMMEKKRKGG